MRRVVAHGAHPVRGKEVREHPGHRAAVLHDVGDPGRRAQVVLQHPPGPLRVADQVDAGDVDAHPVGRGDAHGLAVEVLAGGDEPARDHPVAQDLLLAVDVVEVHLQGLHALTDAALEPGPLGRRDDPRDEIQREGSLLPRQRERDALVDEGAAQCVGAGLEVRNIGRAQLLVDALVGAAHVAVGVEHLVERLGVRTEPVVSAENALVPSGRLGRTCGPCSFCRQSSPAPPVRGRAPCMRSRHAPCHAAAFPSFRQASGFRFG